MIKRLFDIIIASSLFIFVSPLFLIILICIKIWIGGPALFKQLRPGLYNKAFYIYKFRSMTDQKDELGNLLPDEQRITKLGKLLRIYSLDEIPQLLNVLKGELSLVGPRPLLMEYIDLYDEEQARRQHVKPGITGWAQVNGRNGISWEDKFKLDVWYVDHQSFWFDVKIIGLTLIKVLKKEGVSSDGYISTPYFRGTKQNRPPFTKYNDVTIEKMNKVLHTFPSRQFMMDEILQVAHSHQLESIAITHPIESCTNSFFSFVNQVRSISKTYNHIHIYVGCEVKATNVGGQLAAPKEILDQCDVVIGVVDLLHNGHDTRLHERNPNMLAKLEFELAMELIQNASIDILGDLGGTYSHITNKSFPKHYTRRLLEASLERKIAIQIQTSYHVDASEVYELCNEINPYVSIVSDVHQRNMLQPILDKIYQE